MSDAVEIFKEVWKFAVRPRYSFVLWLASLIILVLPLPGFLRLDKFREDYGQWLGPVWLGFFLLWLTEAVLFLWNKGVEYYQKQDEARAVVKRLDSLTPQEAHL